MLDEVMEVALTSKPQTAPDNTFPGTRDGEDGQRIEKEPCRTAVGGGFRAEEWVVEVVDEEMGY